MSYGKQTVALYLIMPNMLRTPSSPDVGEAPSRARLAVAFAAIYLVWGSTYLAILYAIETIPPLLMAGVRNFTAGLILFAWSRARGTPAPARGDWATTLLIGGLMLLGGNGAVTWAEQRIPSGVAALIVATVPLWMVLLAGRRPGLPVMSGVALGLCGVGLLVGPAHFAGGSRIDPVGAAVLVGGALSWSIGSLLARRVRLPGSPHLATGMEMLGGGALLVLAGVLAGEPARLDLAAISLKSMLAMAYLVAAGSLIGFTAYIWLLRHTSPAKVATYAFVNPIVAVALGWLFAGEALSPRTLIAATVIVAGVAFIVTHRTR